MKRRTLRILSIILTVVMFITVQSGCKNDTPEDIETPPVETLPPPVITPTPTPTPTPEDVIIPFEERTELIFGARYVHPSIRPAVTKFNETSGTHRITIVDYSHYDSHENDWMGSIDQLALEIAEGTAPDIIDVSSVPYVQWAARGEFVNLYPLIDADPEINRSDFIESIIKTVEVNGGLYQAFDSFGINTIIGSSSILGEDTQWTLSELTSVIGRNRRANWPLGFQSKDDILRDFIIMNANDFIDWTSGTAQFDSSEFTELLKFANTFPKDWPGYNDPIWNQNLISTGRQIMQLLPFYYFNHSAGDLRELIGDDIVFKGYPVETGFGNIVNIESGLAITAGCEEIDAAWEFLRMFLTQEGQRERIYAGTHLMPVNKVVFDEEMSQELEDPVGGINQYEADNIIAMVNSVTRLSYSGPRAIEDIIRENAKEFFDRRITVTEAARRIQTGVTDYLEEQRG